jgi:hypothetical protein
VAYLQQDDLEDALLLNAASQLSSEETSLSMVKSIRKPRRIIFLDVGTFAEDSES